MTAVQTLTKQNLQSVLNFDGKDNYIDFGKKPELNISKNLTLSAWVNVAKNDIKWTGIVSKVFDTGSTESGYGILLDGHNGVLFALKVPSKGIQYLSSGSNTLTLNQWHHVACTYDGQTMKIYIDGVEKASQNLPDSNIDYDPDHNLYLGTYKDNNEFYPYNGRMAEVRIWNKARSQDEIKQDMNHRLTGKEEGLMAYFPLNGDVLDYSSNNNNGTIIGATWTKENLDFLQSEVSTSVSIDINARVNNEKNAVVKFLKAGSYIVNIKGQKDGGHYDAWSAWSGSPNGCDINGENCSHGWLNQYSIKSNEFQISIDSTSRYNTPELALSHAQTATFTLTKDSSVSFFIGDGNLSDNQGGISLKISPAMANVEIADIVYKGHVKRTQSDEYIEIRNSGNVAADLSNWKVTSIGKNQIFAFPEGTSLAAGQMIRVYTNEVHQESGGFSFGSKTAIWNDKGDTGKLLNAEGKEMSSFSY